MTAVRRVVLALAILALAGCASPPAWVEGRGIGVQLETRDDAAAERVVAEAGVDRALRSSSSTGRSSRRR